MAISMNSLMIPRTCDTSTYAANNNFDLRRNVSTMRDPDSRTSARNFVILHKR